MALLPICGLTQSRNYEYGPGISDIPPACNTKAYLLAEANKTYTIEVKNNYNGIPLLTIKRKTHPSYTIINHEMSCVDIKNLIYDI